MNARCKELILQNTILNNVEVPQPTYNEVSQVRKKLKTRKAARSDTIPAELINKVGQN